MKVGSLFSGIGGFDLGLERAGVEVAWQCEIDPHARAVLAKHWPGVPCYDDVRGITAGAVAPVDLICGGFPCQDVSNAGTTHPGGLTGLAGERSGLWREYLRVIRIAEPRWVVVENVGALTGRGLEVVLWDLAGCGFDAEWAVIPASALGAAHHRKRLFIVAWRPDLLSDAERAGLERYVGGILAQPHQRGQDADLAGSAWGSSAPVVLRGADGIPRGVDGRVVIFPKGETEVHRKERIRELGNAVAVPVAEWIGRRIMAAGVRQ